MTQSTAEQSRVTQGIATGKDLFTLLRDASVFLLAILLIAFPKAFNQILSSAGFDEGNLVGFKWKSGLAESDAALKDARSTIASLEAQLAQTQAALTAAASGTTDPVLKDRASELQLQNERARLAAGSVVKSVQQTIRSNAALVSKAEEALADNGRWVVIFGGDATLSGAKDEIARAQRAGISDTQVYFRQGSYRSVAVVDDRTEAARVAGIARAFRPDAYSVLLSRWCPRTADRGDYLECVSS